jgi:hypothetical protein
MFSLHIFAGRFRHFISNITLTEEKMVKKLLIGFAAVCMSVSSMAQIDNGFGLDFAVGVPSEFYGLDTKWEKGLDGGANFGIKLTSRWYVFNDHNMGIGVQARWLDIYGGRRTHEEFRVGTIDMSLFGLGPIFSYDIGNDMAIDAFYNLRPMLMVTPIATKFQDNWEYEDVALAGGVGHSAGASFRFRVLSLGAEYSFGSLRATYFDEDSLEDEAEREKSRISSNSFRINLGFKF